MRIRGLQTRIVVPFVALLCAMLVAQVLVVDRIGATSAESALAADLETGARAFDRMLAQDAARLTQAARNLSSDPGFRSAVGSNDRAAMRAALADHAARIEADLALLVEADGVVVVDAPRSSLVARDLPFVAMIRDAAVGRAATALATTGGRLWQVAMVPVQGPARGAWIALASGIDANALKDLKNRTGLQVTFAQRTASGWTIAASTLTRPAVARLAATLPASSPRDGPPSLLAMEGQDYLTLVSRQGGSDTAPLVAALQKSRSEAMAPFERMRRRLVEIAGLAVLVAIACGVLLARGITKPMRTLADLARRIAGGDHGETVDIRRGDEVGALAVAFEHMREQIVERESRIQDLAYRDALTGLPNRALFNDRLQQAIVTARRVGRPLTVVMLGLDRFKYINEALGHDCGDQVLIAVGARLRATLPRASDTIARMGSDEFAVLLPTEDANGAMPVIRRLQQALDAPIPIDGHVVDTRASLGIATYPEHGDTLLALLRHADASMYLAKRNNTGFAVYDPRYAEDSPERLSLMSELRHAVEKNELALHFQPKLHLDGSGTLSVEALLRWPDADRGFVPPDEFIPFAEQTGYITTITTWVINQALTHLKAWRKDGLAIDVAINISTRDLMSANFPALVASMLERHRCEAAWLVFEITETALIDDPAQAGVNIDQLHAMGCRISIDDFGTGYSSLDHLRRLKVDELKIDQSFVMGMVDDPGDATIVRATIDFAHSMGLTVVAEGVETDAALRELETMGCDVAQGYLFSRALPAIELLAWFAQSPRIERSQALPQP